MQLLDGASLYRLKAHSDARGALVAFDNATNLPFELRRFFVVRMPIPGIPRAEHACSADQLILVANGVATFDLDDGQRQTSVELTPSDDALWLKAGRWLRMTGRTADTVLVVAASLAYADTRYSDRPGTNFPS